MPLSEGTAKAASFAVGVLLVGLVGEGLLWTASLFAPRPEPGADGVYTVLCVGDSFTYGVGGQAFPDQLEELLDASAQDPSRWRVVNKGVPGYTSRHILERLPEQLKAYQPDVVVVTTGENNRWNSVGLEGVGAVGWRARADAVLLHSRLYRFLKIAWIGWDHATFHEWAGGSAQRVGDVRERVALPAPGDERVAPPLPEAAIPLHREGVEAQLEGEYEAAAARFSALVERWPAEPHGYFAHAGSLLRLGRRAEALEVLRAGAAAAAGSPRTSAARDLVMLLGHVLLEEGDPGAAATVWMDALRLVPTDAELFVLVTDALNAAGGDPWAALAATGAIPGIEDNVAHQELRALRDATGARDQASMDALVAEGLRRDAARILDLATAHGARVVFTSYPLHAYVPVSQAAREGGAPYLDLVPVFAALFSHRDEFISSDGCHANTQGYRVMAAAIAPVVRAFVGEPVGPTPTEPGAVLAAAREALVAYQAAGGGPEEGMLEPPQTAEQLAEEAAVDLACDRLISRLESMGGEELSDLVGSRMRLRMRPAEMVALCAATDDDDDDALMDRLRATLDLERSGL